jgi:signal transduction histidine kinase
LPRIFATYFCHVFLSRIFVTIQERSMPPDTAQGPVNWHPHPHPMELFPWLRRWPPSLLRDLCYTLLLNILIALGFTALALLFGRPAQQLAHLFWANFVITNLIGYLIHTALLAINYLTGDWPSRATPWAFRLYFLVVVLLCVVLGILFGTALLEAKNPLAYLHKKVMLPQSLALSLLVACLLYWIMMTNQQRFLAENRAAHASLRHAEQAALLLKAQLQALQAQIEPHFLYNTLANVQGLIHSQPELASQMLERLIRFLRANLAASRAEQTTLGNEADLIADYLAVMALRMGPRLKWHIKLPDALRELPLAPMLLQPLVENAISHGLEPKVEGGTLTLDCQQDGATLLIRISDTGVGIDTGRQVPTIPSSQKPGGGVGLSNLRQRLQQLYGNTAHLALSENTPCGLCVTLSLPLPTPSSAHGT